MIENNIFTIDIEITNYCHFDCIYCDAGRINDKINININTIELIIKYINSYLPEYKINLRTNNGEPFLHPHFDKVIAELMKLHSYSFILMTNGSVPFTSFNINYSLFHQIYISIHVDINNKDTKYFHNVLNNIYFLLDNKITPYIYIMKSRITKETQIMEVYNIIFDIFMYYHINSNNFQIITAHPNDIYKDENYDYFKSKNVKFNIPVYNYRAIKLYANGQLNYKCPQIKTTKMFLKVAYLPSVWKYIRQHINNKIICKWSYCFSPLCTKAN